MQMCIPVTVKSTIKVRERRESPVLFILSLSVTLKKERLKQPQCEIVNSQLVASGGGLLLHTRHKSADILNPLDSFQLGLLFHADIITQDSFLDLFWICGQRRLCAADRKQAGIWWNTLSCRLPPSNLQAPRHHREQPSVPWWERTCEGFSPARA